MDDDGDQVDPVHDVLATGDAEAYRTLKMTVKVPPAFDGHVQTSGYFAYEDSVEEWESITTTEQRFRGPHLRNRLVGEAMRLKPLFDMAQLRILTEVSPTFCRSSDRISSKTTNTFSCGAFSSS